MIIVNVIDTFSEMINARIVIVATLLFSAATTFILAAITIRRRKTIGILATIFTLVLASVTIYSFGYAMELLNTTLEGVMLWLRVEHIGIQTLPVMWFLFALFITGNDKWLTIKRLSALFVVPAIVLISIFTNEWHNLFYQNPRLITQGVFSTFHFEKGPIYYLNIFNINLMLLISTVLFTRMLIRSATPFRRQALVFFISATIPWVGMTLYLTGKTPYNLDFSPIFLSISVLLFTLGIFEFHIFDVVPLAHDIIFKGMSDGVLVLDLGNRIVDFNPALPSIIPEVKKTCIGSSAMEVLESYPKLIEQIINNSSGAIELQFSRDEEAIYYQSKISPVLDRQKREVGKILTMHDYTETKLLLQQLQNLATVDGLTGVYNRRYFTELANREIVRVERYGGDLSLIMLDLDYFKKVNDTYGHAAGDAVLISVATLCYGTIRKTDIFSRFGGEEFIILLPETNFPAAMALAERLRQAIEMIRIKYTDLSLSITASFGVTSVNSPKTVVLDDLLLLVDKYVYEAKENGRNCVRGCAYTEVNLVQE
ncbi:MAG: diguanylate cyclase [Anaerolineales bacterium]|nr:diguanylate cyclase [Anaerolineales bacterium]